MAEEQKHYLKPDGSEYPAEVQKYIYLNEILLLVEDDSIERRVLENSAKRYCADRPSTGICAVSSVPEALKELSLYCQYSPDARLNSILDYNMGKNEASSERRPTEALFMEKSFLDYLNNGGLTIIYSGSWAQEALRSPSIQNALHDKEKFAFLLAIKSEVGVDQVVQFLVNNSSLERVSKIREAAPKFKFNLGEILKAGQAARRR